jgi:hypothetical protein
MFGRNRSASRLNPSGFRSRADLRVPIELERSASAALLLCTPQQNGPVGSAGPLWFVQPSSERARMICGTEERPLVVSTRGRRGWFQLPLCHDKTSARLAAGRIRGHLYRTCRAIAPLLPRQDGGPITRRGAVARPLFFLAEQQNGPVVEPGRSAVRKEREGLILDRAPLKPITPIAGGRFQLERQEARLRGGAGRGDGRRLAVAPEFGSGLSHRVAYRRAFPVARCRS